MIKEWEKFKGWRTLEYFLLWPNAKIHINGLARELGISPRTANLFCKEYHEEGLLQKSEIGNVHQFCLNEKDARVQALKRFIGPYLVADGMQLKTFLGKNKNVLSVSIYGSFASGDYGDKSDLDVLVITADEKKPDAKQLAELELTLGREVAVTAINLAKWREMERKNDGFFISIRKNNVLIWGNKI